MYDIFGQRRKGNCALEVRMGNLQVAEEDSNIHGRIILARQHREYRAYRSGVLT